MKIMPENGLPQLPQLNVREPKAGKQAFSELLKASEVELLNHKAPSAQDNTRSTIADEKVKVARDFEAMFINMMLKSMRDTVSTDGLLKKSNGEKIYQSMLDNETANGMAKQDAMGISKMVLEFLNRGEQMDNIDVAEIAKKSNFHAKL